MPHNLSIITDVHADAPKRELVQGRIDSKVYDYFFRKVFAGTHGPRNAFVAMFFQRFYEACVLNGIAPVWDETNEQRINEVLQRLNFSQAVVVPVKRKKKEVG